MSNVRSEWKRVRMNGQPGPLKILMKNLFSLLGGTAAVVLSSCADYYGYDSAAIGGYASAPLAVQSSVVHQPAFPGYQSGADHYSSPVRSAFPLHQSYLQPVSNYSSRGWGDYRGSYQRSSRGYYGGGGSSCGVGRYY